MKVFGIGFHKTATKSLAKALTQLAYKQQALMAYKIFTVSKMHGELWSRF